jgi:WD40 repeat protein
LKSSALSVRDARTGRWIRTFARDNVRDLVRQNDGTLVAVAYDGRQATILDAVTGTRLRSVPLRIRDTESLTLSPDGLRLAGSDWGKGWVSVWSARTGEELRRFSLSRGATRLQFSPDGKRLACVPTPMGHDE